MFEFINEGNITYMLEFMRDKFESINGIDNPYSYAVAMDMFTLGNMPIGDSVYWFPRRNGTAMTDAKDKSMNRAQRCISVEGGYDLIRGFKFTRLNNREYLVEDSFRVYA